MQFIDFFLKNDISPYEHLDGRELFTLSGEELQQVKDLHENGLKEGFHLVIEPYNITPELQMEIYSAPTKAKQFEIFSRLQCRVSITRISNLTSLSGSK